MSDCSKCGERAEHDSLMFSWDNGKPWIVHICSNPRCPEYDARQGHSLFYEPVEELDAVLARFGLQKIGPEPKEGA